MSEDLVVKVVNGLLKEGAKRGKKIEDYFEKKRVEYKKRFGGDITLDEIIKETQQDIEALNLDPKSPEYQRYRSGIRGLKASCELLRIWEEGVRRVTTREEAVAVLKRAFGSIDEYLENTRNDIEMQVVAISKIPLVGKSQAESYRRKAVKNLEEMEKALKETN